MLRNYKALIAVLGVLALAAAPTMATNVVKLDWAKLSVSYDANTGKLNVFNDNNTMLNAHIVSNMAPGVDLDMTQIYNAIDPNPDPNHQGKTNVLLNMGINNPAGLDNISAVGGMLAGTDLNDTLANPSVAADFMNAAFGVDLDGITYVPGAGVLTIYGRLSTITGNDSILLNPAAGDWTFIGEDDGSVGPGSDGVADQISIADAWRDNYDNGTLFMLQLSLNAYSDGSPITATNADDLFAAGKDFDATGADMKVDIIPAPGAILLGCIGLGLVGWIKRRFA